MERLCLALLAGIVATSQGPGGGGDGVEGDLRKGRTMGDDVQGSEQWRTPRRGVRGLERPHTWEERRSSLSLNILEGERGEEVEERLGGESHAAAETALLAMQGLKRAMCEQACLLSTLSVVISTPASPFDFWPFPPLCFSVLSLCRSPSPLSLRPSHSRFDQLLSLFQLNSPKSPFLPTSAPSFVPISVTLSVPSPIVPCIPASPYQFLSFISHASCTEHPHHFLATLFFP